MSNQSSRFNVLDKRRIRESFDAAAEGYDDAAVLQQEVGTRILERLELIKINPEVILDVGAGTGTLSQALGKRYKKSRVISLDLAPRMLQVARGRNSWLTTRFGNQGFVCGDAEKLPIADNSVDLIFSSLALQWCGELEQAFAEFRRVLKPEGLLMFTTFGPDTLKELRHSWQAADAEHRVHVNDFTDMHDVGDALLRAGLADPVMDVEHFTLTYPDAYQLMRELKTIGAHNVASERRHSLTGKSRLRNMVAAYEQLRVDGTLPATYEVVYGHAWGPTQKRQVNIPLSTLAHDFKS
jgi:malonyl-CoA O-methyltransferase